MALNKLPRSGIADSAVTTAKVSDGVINAATEFPDSTIASDRIADCAVTNAKLSNSAITIRGTSVSLGGSLSVNPNVNWQSKVTSDGSTVTTMVAGQGYFVDNSSAAGIVKLPASAAIGDTVAIKDYAGNFASNNLTVQRNSHNIQGAAADSLIVTNRASVVLVYVDSTKGWLYAGQSNADDLQSKTFISATGGTVTTTGNDRVHTFTGDGNFVVSSVGNSVGGADKVSYLVLAGGGGGGGSPSPAGNGGGGGGAGGFREGKDAPISSYTVSPLNAPAGLTVSASPGTYPVTVGAGSSGGPGASHPTGSAGRGNNSVFSTITSTGGGGGAANPISSTVPTQPGGSGGGGSQTQAVGAGNTPPVSPPQGNNATPASSPNEGGSGGAGAGGSNPATRNPNGGTLGGAGVTSHITGSPVVRAGGGGGGGQSGKGSDGGAGSGAGGGGGAPRAAGNGTANRGSGGGGGGYGGSGGNGGSGIVIIRYKYQDG